MEATHTLFWELGRSAKEEFFVDWCTSSLVSTFFAAHVILINIRLSFSDFRYQRIYATVNGFFTKRCNLVEYLYLIRRANDNSITSRDLNPLTPKIWLLILLSRCYTFPFNELFNQLIYAYGISFSSNA